MLRNLVILPEIFLAPDGDDDYWDDLSDLLEHVTSSHNMVLDVFGGSWRKSVLGSLTSPSNRISTRQATKIRARLEKVQKDHLIEGLRNSPVCDTLSDYERAMGWAPQEAVALVLGSAARPDGGPKYKRFRAFLLDERAKQEVGGALAVSERTPHSILEALYGVLAVSKTAQIFDRYIYANLDNNLDFVAALMDILGSALKEAPEANLDISVSHEFHSRTDSKESVRQNWIKSVKRCKRARGVLVIQLWTKLTHDRFLFTNRHRVLAPSGLCPIEAWSSLAEREFVTFTWADPKIHALAISRNQPSKWDGYKESVRLPLPCQGGR